MISDKNFSLVSMGDGCGGGDAGIYGEDMGGDGRGDGVGYGYLTPGDNPHRSYDGDGSGDGWFFAPINTHATSRGDGDRVEPTQQGHRERRVHTGQREVLETLH